MAACAAQHQAGGHARAATSYMYDGGRPPPTPGAAASVAPARRHELVELSQVARTRTLRLPPAEQIQVAQVVAMPMSDVSSDPKTM